HGNVDGYQQVAGFVGNSGGVIEFCAATGSVTATTTSAGGLVGQAGVGGVIRDSTASGSVQGRSSVGGLIGAISTTGFDIYRSSAHGRVFGHEQVGGLVGNANNDTSGKGTVEDCYATGVVFGTYRRVGGLFGRADMLTVARSHARNVVNSA